MTALTHTIKNDSITNVITHYKVKISKRAQKSVKKLPAEIQDMLTLLILDIKRYGPIQKKLVVLR